MMKNCLLALLLAVSGLRPAVGEEVRATKTLELLAAKSGEALLIHKAHIVMVLRDGSNVWIYTARYRVRIKPAQELPDLRGQMVTFHALKAAIEGGGQSSDQELMTDTNLDRTVREVLMGQFSARSAIVCEEFEILPEASMK